MSIMHSLCEVFVLLFSVGFNVVVSQFLYHAKGCFFGYELQFDTIMFVGIYEIFILYHLSKHILLTA